MMRSLVEDLLKEVSGDKLDDSNYRLKVLLSLENPAETLPVVRSGSVKPRSIRMAEEMQCKQTTRASFLKVVLLGLI